MTFASEGRALSESEVVSVQEEIRIGLPVVSWRAILAGLVMALVVHLLLALLGGAIGLAFIDPTAADNPRPSTVSVVAIIWWTLSGILAAWVGGLTAGRMCGQPATSTAAWHGLVAWGATTLVVFYLLTTAIGGLIGGAFSALGTVATAAGSAASGVAGAATAAVDPFAPIDLEIKDATGANDLQSAREAVSGFVRMAFTGEGQVATDATSRATDALARAARITPEEAGKRLAEWKASYENTVAEGMSAAKQAADTARKTASGAGITAFIALLFGALAGWYGGWASPLPNTDIGFDRRIRERYRRRT